MVIYAEISDCKEGGFVWKDAKILEYFKEGNAPELIIHPFRCVLYFDLIVLSLHIISFCNFFPNIF